MVFVLIFCGMFITMIRAAMALEENSRYLKLVYGSRETVTQLITMWEPSPASTVTVTAELHKTEGTATQTHEQTVEEILTEWVMETATATQWV
jgi:hypothetical protein